MDETAQQLVKMFGNISPHLQTPAAVDGFSEAIFSCIRNSREKFGSHPAAMRHISECNKNQTSSGCAGKRKSVYLAKL